MPHGEQVEKLGCGRLCWPANMFEENTLANLLGLKLARAPSTWSCSDSKQFNVFSFGIDEVNRSCG